MVLQLGGGCVVLADLISRAREHGHAGIFRGVLAWIRAGLVGRRIVLGASAGSFVTTTAKGRGSARAPQKVSPTIEERVAAIETNLAHIDLELRQTFRELDQMEQDLNAKWKAEVAARANAIGELRERLRMDALNNFGLLAFGAFWVLVGTVLSALSPEIARIVAGQWSAVLQSF